MTIDPISRNVYITDTGNNRIIKLDDKYNFILDGGLYDKRHDSNTFMS